MLQFGVIAPLMAECIECLFVALVPRLEKAEIQPDNAEMEEDESAMDNAVLVTEGWDVLLTDGGEVLKKDQTEARFGVIATRIDGVVIESQKNAGHPERIGYPFLLSQILGGRPLVAKMAKQNVPVLGPTFISVSRESYHNSDSGPHIKTNLTLNMEA